MLAEAIFAELLAGAPQLDVSAQSASVGPAFAGEHDERVVDAAAAAGVALLPRRPRAFDEAIDIVAFDLVLVMDHFDCEDVRGPRRPAMCMFTKSLVYQHHRLQAGAYSKALGN